MLTLMPICAVLVILAGLAVKFWLDRSRSSAEITWKEFAVGSAIACVLTPLLVYAFFTQAQASEREFTQYLNGWETGAIAEVITCTRDGSCRWYYDCDPYEVWHPEVCTTDSKGNRSCSPGYYTTEYHSCPYCTTETNYSVATTLGSFAIDSHRFPLQPNSNRWRSGHEVPGGVIASAGAGEPPDWTAAKMRLDNKLPGPVTKRGIYTNYLLASDSTLFQRYQGVVEKYKTLLPDLNSKVDFPYHASKLYLAGLHGFKYRGLWDIELEYLNAALGYSRQGDLHLVLVNSGRVSDSTEYQQALLAYWQNKDKFQRQALGKNTVVVIIGTDGETVQWAKAATGMPIGNDALIVAIEKGLKGQPLNVGSIIGETRRHAGSGDISTGSGVLEHALLDAATRFERPHMQEFLYLARETPVPAFKQFLTMAAASVISSIVWLIFAFVGERAQTFKSNFRRY